MVEEFLGIFNYAATLFLVLYGLYTVTVCNNLIRKMIGIGILQIGVILFWVSAAYKKSSSLPIIDHHHLLPLEQIASPLPHALMLTAFVVGVSTLGVGLSLITMIYRYHQSIEEDIVLKQIKDLDS